MHCNGEQGKNKKKLMFQMMRASPATFVTEVLIHQDNWRGISLERDIGGNFKKDTQEDLSTCFHFDNALLKVYYLSFTPKKNMLKSNSLISLGRLIPKTQTKYRGVSQPNIATISLILSALHSCCTQIFNVLIDANFKI